MHPPAFRFLSFRAALPGAAWFELEHQSFGIDFKTVRGRLEALDEACRIIRGMWTQPKTTLHGTHYRVTDAMCVPGPLQRPHPPIMIGGLGRKVLLKLVATHADMWNAAEAPDTMREAVLGQGDELICMHKVSWESRC